MQMINLHKWGCHLHPIIRLSQFRGGGGGGVCCLPKCGVPCTTTAGKQARGKAL